MTTLIHIKLAGGCFINEDWTSFYEDTVIRTTLILLIYACYNGVVLALRRPIVTLPPDWLRWMDCCHTWFNLLSLSFSMFYLTMCHRIIDYICCYFEYFMEHYIHVLSIYLISSVFLLFLHRSVCILKQSFVWKRFQIQLKMFVFSAHWLPLYPRELVISISQYSLSYELFQQTSASSHEMILSFVFFYQVFMHVFVLTRCSGARNVHFVIQN